MKSERHNQESTLRDPRRAIMDVLKRQGAQPAARLATRFGVTAMAVRQHLYALQEEGMVEAHTEPTGRGRPTKLWVLTGKAQGFFPDAHQELAVDLLGHMRAQFGDAGLHGIIDRHSEAQGRSYEAVLVGTKTLEARVHALARLRNDEGYMAEVKRDGEGWLLIENHCPICAAARSCTRLCANELDVFTRVLGPTARVVREEHMLSGARRCAYRITPQS
ncbi:MAG: transcriptional regulator [Robiginitomaculum sp.]|nr:MAG: transcriptional regulator [Robiginitomaculum sp.]